MERERVDGERRAYRVVGRVQGVGFRWWTRRTAEELGLAGWVRNDADGSVVVHASGSADALGLLEAALLRGPMGSRVDRVGSLAPDGSVQGGGFQIEGENGD